MKSTAARVCATRGRRENVSTAAEEQAWNVAQLAAFDGTPRFRVWTHRSPAIVLGSAQRALRNATGPRANGRVELLDRQAGGGAVLTGPGMVSASVVLPYGHGLLGGGLIASYRWLGQLHVAALAEFGITACALPPETVARAHAAISVRKVEWACFGGLSPWEVVAADCRKLVGLAQRRQRSGVLLVAGTLVGATDWRLLCDVMGHPEDEAALLQRTVSCEQLAGGPMAPSRYASVLTRLIGESLAS